MTSPPWMPMPTSSGSGNSLASAWFISPTCQSIRRAASKACAQASSAPVSAPKIAITPSPINWLGVPPAAVMALPTASKNRFRMKTTSNGNRFSTSSVDRRISTNRMATNRSVPLSLRFNKLWSAIVVCGGKSGQTLTSATGLSWQARRTARSAPSRASTRASTGACGGRRSRPSSTRTRQVEQRARPPQSEACGIPARRLASSTLSPLGMRTDRPSG